jgi:PAS domain S-box-containing protein
MKFTTSIRQPFRDLIALVLAVTLGLTATLWGWRITRQQQAEARASDLIRQAESRHALIRETIAGYEESLLSLKLLFTYRQPIDRELFSAASLTQLSRHKGFLALEWAPRVAGSDRLAWEKKHYSELAPWYRIRERTRGGKDVIAPDRDVYYPLLYVEPYAENKKILGSDTSISPLENEIKQAIANDTFQFGGLMKLVFERGSNDGIILVCPVRPAPPAESGVILGVFFVKDLLNQPWSRAPASELDVMFIDESATRSDRRLLYYHQASGSTTAAVTEAAFLASPHLALKLDLGNRTWNILYRHSAQRAQSSTIPYLVLMVGLSSTLLGTGYLASRLRRSQLIEDKVLERTTQLIESQRRLDNFMHALPGLVYRCRYLENQLIALYVSQGAFDLTGYHPADFSSGVITFTALTHPEDLERVTRDTQAALRERRAVEVEYRLLHRDGTEKWVLSRAHGVYTAEGKIQFFEGLAIDITAQKKAESDRLALERKLLDSQKLESLGLLAGGIAHDFNNLLTAILGSTSLARLELPAGADRTALEHIETASQRAAELCAQMLAYAGKGRFIVEPAHLSLLVEGVHSLLKISVGHRATLTLDLDPDLPAVMVDATQIRQIIVNLVLNAAEAIGEGGVTNGSTIRIRTGLQRVDPAALARAVTGSDCKPGAYVFLEVADTGPGMTAAVLGKIFDPFYTTKFTGRGLGLAAVLGIVRGHEGALLVSSTPGTGTTFRLLLPAIAARPDSAAPKNIGSTEPWRYQGTALVIDDDNSVRLVTTAILRSFGLTVTSASDGQAGLEAWRAAPEGFDFVVLDLLMPGLNGEATLNELRKLRPCVRVLIISGFNEGDFLTRHAGTGPLGYLHKPFKLADLERAARRLLD